MKESELVPIADRIVGHLVDRWGGWENVLSPSFLMNDEIYTDFDKVGISRSKLDKWRANSDSLRISYLYYFSYSLYWSWRYFVKGSLKSSTLVNASPFSGNARWQDHPDGELFWAELKSTMLKLGITRDEIEDFIRSDPHEFTIWLAADETIGPSDEPPSDLSRVPKKPYPPAGHDQTARPLPLTNEDS